MANKSEKNHQMALVEVRGVEPRSAEFSVSNSPSAAAVWLSARRITAAFSVRAHPESPWPGGPGNPPGASRISDAPVRRGGNPPERTGYLSIRQPAPFVVWHLLCLPSCFTRNRKPRLASEHGDHSTSNPSHPHVLSVRPLYNPPVTNPPPLFGPAGQNPSKRRPTRRTPRSISRRSSRSLITCRLSTLVRPLARANSSFAFPRRK